MRFRPGSWPWLLGYELKIAWRGFTESAVPLLLLVGVGWVILHAVAAGVMRAYSPEMLDGTALAIGGLAFWLAMSLMLSSALFLSVGALFDRGDLDLLVSSPIATRTIFVVRGLGVAVNAVALFAALFLPFAHLGMVYGHWQLALAYPVLVSTALGVAGAAFALTLLLVRWFGARRTRVFGQVLSALVGASFFLVLQIPNLVRDEVRERWFEALPEWLDTPWLGDSSPLWWPIRALFGDPLPALFVIGAGVGLFGLVTRATSRAFVAGTQESLTARAKRTRTGQPEGFRRGLARNVIAKELRLIRRDPNLIAKTLLYSLYLIPMVAVLARNADLGTTVGPVVIVLFAGTAGNLAWITIAGEEAPDLVGSAPVSRERVRWLKAAAALTPLGYAALPFVAFFLWRSVWMAGMFVVFLSLALGASAVTQVWGGKPAPKRDLKMRQKNVGLNLVEFLSTADLAGACYLALTFSWWALAVLPLGLLAPAVAWNLRRETAV